MEGSNCASEQINFTIWEYDPTFLAPDDEVASLVDSFDRTNWNALYLDEGGFDPDPEYYFVAFEVGNESNSVNSQDLGNPLLEVTESGAPSEFDGWRAVIKSSQQDYEEGRLPGEGLQYPHSMVRSLSNPDYIYWAHDCGQGWRSTDGGDTWERFLAKGLGTYAGQSIEVDPVNPNTVFITMDNNWITTISNFTGLYKSTDRGDTWELVLPVDYNEGRNNDIHNRVYKHNIAYALDSVVEDEARVWYAAFADDEVAATNQQGLYKSTDGGDTWTLTSADLTGHIFIYALYVNPQNSDIIYLGSNQGLFTSTDGGNTLVPLGNFPADRGVGSIQINLQNPNEIYVTLIHNYLGWSNYATYNTEDIVYYESRSNLYRSLIDNNIGNTPDSSPAEWQSIPVDAGLYKSINGGASFSQMVETGNSVNAFINPGYPEVIYFLKRIDWTIGPNSGVEVSQDGGNTWNSIISNPREGLGRNVSWGSRFRVDDGLGAIIPNPANRCEAVGYAESYLWKTEDCISFNHSNNLFSGYAWTCRDSIFFDPDDVNKVGMTGADTGLFISENSGLYYERIESPYSILYDYGFRGNSFDLKAGLFYPDSDEISASGGNIWGRGIQGMVRSNDNDGPWEQTYIDGGIWNVTNITRGLWGSFRNYFYNPSIDVLFVADKKSSDHGRNFENITFLVENDLEIYGMCKSNNSVMYALDNVGQDIYRSDDAGDTWNLYVHKTPYSYGSGYSTTSDLTFDMDPVDCDKIYTLYEGGDLASYDGSQWQALGLLSYIRSLPENAELLALHSNPGYPGIGRVIVDPNDNSIIYATTTHTGVSAVFRSVDGGASWQDISYNLPRAGYADAFSISPYSGEIFVGGCSGTWIFPPPYNLDSPLYRNSVSRPSCNDSLQNGDETGVDTGGSCNLVIPAPVCGDLICLGNATYNEDYNSCPGDCGLPVTYPIARFDVEPGLTVRVGEEVFFDASASEDDVDFLINEDNNLYNPFKWDFGDGYAMNSTSPYFSNEDGGVSTTHFYITPGVYNVILNVTDHEGNSGSTSKTITVIGEVDYPSGFELWHANFHARTAQYIYAQIPSALALPSNRINATITGDIEPSKVLLDKTGISTEEIFLLNNSALNADNYTLTVEILDSESNVVGKVTEYFEKPYDGIPEVGINEDNSLVVNGELFFPVASWVRHYWDYQSWSQDKGINTVLGLNHDIVRNPANYGFAEPIEGWKASLDEATVYSLHAMGPTVWEGLKGSHTGGLERRDTNISMLRRYVNETKDHEAMLAWNWLDEPDLGNYSQYAPPFVVRSWTYESHKLDSQHPVFTGFVGYDFSSHTTQWHNIQEQTFSYLYNKDLFGGRKTFVADIYGMDYYPFEFFMDAWPQRGYICVEDMVDSMEIMRAWNYDLVPFLAFVEVDGWADASTPPPTQAQIKQVSWLNVIHGAKIIGWFVNPNPPENAQAMKEFEEHITQLTPIVLGPEVARTVTDDANVGGSRVDTMVRENGTDVWLIAVRVTEPDEPQSGDDLSVTFNIENFADGTAEVFNETDVGGNLRTINVIGGQFTDSFAPNDVHIYKISGGVSVPCTLTNASWSTSSTTEGTQVQLIVEGNNCNGEEVSFEIREDDFLFDDGVDIAPDNVTFSGNTATGTWTTEFHADWGANEYYFIASLVSNPTENVNSKTLGNALLSVSEGVVSESPYIWENGPSSDPNFFPIAVWYQSPSNAGNYRNIGVNTYIRPIGVSESDLTTLETYGMPVLADQDSVGLTSPRNYLIEGWTQMDEPDNAQWNGTDYEPCIDPVIIQQLYNNMKANDATRPVYLNFGRGVSHETWGGRGVCTGNLSMYPEYIKGADIISYDIYPVTSCSGSASAIRGRLEYVARGVDRLVNWSNGTKIVWNAIETTHISCVDDRPTPEEIKAEVWMSLIHGSMGITYFVHEWEPSFREDAIFRYPEIVGNVTEINAQITALAPVLNSPTIEDVVQVSSSTLVDTMVKEHSGSTYLFAVGMENVSTSATFTIPGIATGVVDVLGENRQISINNNQFQDNFDAYGVHLYNISEGVCTPDCAGRECGDDGCGGSCGSCTGNEVCNASGQCNALTFPNDYVSWWKFDGDATDERGLNDGIENGNPGYASGMQDQAISLNGATDYVDIPVHQSLNLINQTRSIWINMDLLQSYNMLFSDVAMSYIGVMEAGNIRLGYQNSSANAEYTNFGSFLTSGNWHHLAFVYSIEGQNVNIDYYINGSYDSSVIGSHGFISSPINRIGYRTLYYDGLIDNVMVYNRSLSAAEIQEIYNAQGVPSVPQLPLYSKFDGSTTNFSEVTDITSVTSAVLENTTYGMINFSGETIDFSGLDLDSFVSIENNSIIVDSVALPELNVSAILTVYGSFTDPEVLQDGQPCSSGSHCSIIENTGTYVRFTVDHFTNYTVRERVQAVCGDGILGGTEQCDNGTGNTDTPNLNCYGQLSYCNTSCSSLIATCNRVCGDGTIDLGDGEVCDGSNLGGENCTTILGNFVGGSLSCAASCMSFDTTSCIAGPSTAIIINHTAVDLYDNIPQYYIDEVKKMSLYYPGESHGSGLPRGLELINDSTYTVNVRWSGTQELYTDQYLRVLRDSRGEWNTWVNPTQIISLNNYLQTNQFDAFAWGWCWDMTASLPGGSYDPVYHVRWAGTTHLDGAYVNDQGIWGLDSDDSILTGNLMGLNMNNYTEAWEFYQENNPDAAIIYTTGPVDGGGNTGERGYQRYLKHEYIRNHVVNNGGYLFDYADILTHNEAGNQNLVSWTDQASNLQYFPYIHPDNMLDLNGTYTEDGDHIGEVGTVRLAKAMWVLLAMKAGWDGTPESVIENCTDQIKNQNETDIDCGGSCPACQLGKSCLVDGDCVTNNCTGGICVFTPTEISATVETEPVAYSGDTADDPAIWVHPTDPSQSVIIGTNKNTNGGLVVYDLSGTELYFTADDRQVNNVDVRYNFTLNGEQIDIVATNDRNDGSLGIYKIDPVSKELIDIGGTNIMTGFETYGFCLYHSAVSGEYYAFVNDKSGDVQQWRLFDNGDGTINGMMERTFDVGSQPEGMVADDELGYLYIGEEDVAVWKYGAEPGDDSSRVQVDSIGVNLVADIEGLTIYYTNDGNGYFIASSQGDNSFSVYDRITNDFIMNFELVPNTELGIDDLYDTDGIDVISTNLGPAFPNGVFVAQDGNNSLYNQNFKLVPWERIAGSVYPNLEIDNTWNPREHLGELATLLTGQQAAAECSECGEGLWNVCDETECLGLESSEITGSASRSSYVLGNECIYKSNWYSLGLQGKCFDRPECSKECTEEGDFCEGELAYECVLDEYGCCLNKIEKQVCSGEFVCYKGRCLDERLLINLPVEEPEEIEEVEEKIEELEEECIMRNCSALGKKCGTWEGCGELLDCGNCSEGEVCSNGTCILKIECNDTCLSLGYECGIWSICGGNVNCGGCNSGFNCSNGKCKEVQQPCVPNNLSVTCGTWVCGSKVNNCNQTVSCGSCSEGYECENGICKQAEQPPQSLTFPQDYIIYYKFNGNMNDETGVNNAKCYSEATCPVYTTGFEGGAYEFDGIDDFIKVEAYNYYFNNGFTYSAWINVKNLPESDWKIDSVLSIWVDSNNSISLGIQRSSSDVWRIVSIITAGGSKLGTSSGPVANPSYHNNWVHIALIGNQTNNIIYENGVEVGRASTNGIQFFSKNMGLKNIGNKLDGKIDDVMVYDRALSQTEIRQIYCSQGGQAGFCSNGVYFNFLVLINRIKSKIIGLFILDKKNGNINGNVIKNIGNESLF